MHNVIDSTFRFEDGMIIQQHDVCDARAWAAMALAGVGGFLAGRFRILRSFKAQQMLKNFVNKHTEYQ